MTKALAQTTLMASSLEWGINSGPTMSGRVDALAHVGKLIQGEWTPEFLAEVQTTNLDADAEPGYIRGYTETWNALYGIASGVSIDEVHKVAF